MDGDTFAEEWAALDGLEFREETPPTVNDDAPPPVKDGVTDAAPAEADASQAEAEAEADAAEADAAEADAAEADADAADPEPQGDADPPAAQPRSGAATDLPPDGPRDEPPPPVTGDDAVDAATAEVADTAADPLESRLAAYERAHRTLQDRLADVEG
jgi:hypothetical protein